MISGDVRYSLCEKIAERALAVKSGCLLDDFQTEGKREELSNDEWSYLWDLFYEALERTTNPDRHYGDI